MTDAVDHSQHGRTDFRRSVYSVSRVLALDGTRYSQARSSHYRIGYGASHLSHVDTASRPKSATENNDRGRRCLITAE